MKKANLILSVLVILLFSCEKKSESLIKSFQKAIVIKKKSSNSSNLALTICDKNNYSKIGYYEDSTKKEFVYLGILDSKTNIEFDTNKKIFLRQLLKESELLGDEYFAETSGGKGVLVFDWKGDFDKIYTFTNKVLKNYYEEEELKGFRVQILEYSDSLNYTYEIN